MRIIFLLLLSNICFGQTFKNDTTLTGTYNAGGKIMNIQAKISGNVTITNAIIEAGPFIQIFDTTVILGANVQTREFSGMWYGAKSANADNSRQLQFAIDACINKAFPLFIPAGEYRTNKPLIVSIPLGNNIFAQAKIKMYGQTSMWPNGFGDTKIIYSGDSCALGFQLNKGSEISNLWIKGGWVSPIGSDMSYYNTSYDNYTNQAASGNGQGIWIDPVGNWNQRSGSTGLYFHDLYIEKFKTLIKISNGATQNAEIIIFDRVQFGDARTGVETSQAQEKANKFDGIYSWGAIHTLFYFSNQAGNYYITNGNIAGKCIRLFRVYSQTWFPTHITNFYAEAIGTIGDISTQLPMSISNSVFDFIDPSKVGNITLLNSGGNDLKFDNCMFRYYGYGNKLNMKGMATFNNCYFSAEVLGSPLSIFTNYSYGQTITSGTKVVEFKDTIIKPSVIIKIRSSRN